MCELLDRPQEKWVLSSFGHPIWLRFLCLDKVLYFPENQAEGKARDNVVLLRHPPTQKHPPTILTKIQRGN